MPVLFNTNTPKNKPKSTLEPSDNYLKALERKIAAMDKDLDKRRKGIITQEAKSEQLVKEKEALSRLLIEKNRSTINSAQLEKRKCEINRSPGDEEQPKKNIKTSEITPPKPS